MSLARTTPFSQDAGGRAIGMIAITAVGKGKLGEITHVGRGAEGGVPDGEGVLSRLLATTPRRRRPEQEV